MKRTIAVTFYKRGPVCNSPSFPQVDIDSDGRITVETLGSPHPWPTVPPRIMNVGMGYRLSVTAYRGRGRKRSSGWAIAAARLEPWEPEGTPGSVS